MESTELKSLVNIINKFKKFNFYVTFDVTFFDNLREWRIILYYIKMDIAKRKVNDSQLILKMLSTLIRNKRKSIVMLTAETYHSMNLSYYWNSDIYKMLYFKLSILT